MLSGGNIRATAVNRHLAAALASFETIEQVKVVQKVYIPNNGLHF